MAIPKQYFTEPSFLQDELLLKYISRIFNKKTIRIKFTPSKQFQQFTL